MKPLPSVGLADMAKGAALSEVLIGLMNDTERERISLGDLLGAMGDRAIGALMFIFAVPNVLPVPPGVSAILGTPLIFLSAQLMFGRAPWLPAFVTRRSLAIEDFRTLMQRVLPWLAKGEKLLQPRWTVLTKPPVEYLVGLVCLLLSLILALPIPLGNMLPALAISLLALGVLERDGYWILAGTAVSVVASIVVSGVVYAMVKAAIFMITEVL